MRAPEVGAVENTSLADHRMPKRARPWLVKVSESMTLMGFPDAAAF